MKRTRVKKITTFIVLASFLVAIAVTTSPVIFGQGDGGNTISLSSQDYVKLYAGLEKSNVGKLTNIWAQIDKSYNDWVAGKTDREGLAKATLPLLKKLDEIKKSHDNFSKLGTPANLKKDKTYSSCGILSESLRLKTEVMLFDLVKGFELEGNPHGHLDKLNDETLKFVYERRKKAFENDVRYFLGILQQLESAHGEAAVKSK